MLTPKYTLLAFAFTMIVEALLLQYLHHTVISIFMAVCGVIVGAIGIFYIGRQMGSDLEQKRRRQLELRIYILISIVSFVCIIIGFVAMVINLKLFDPLFATPITIFELGNIVVGTQIQEQITFRNVCQMFFEIKYGIESDNFGEKLTDQYLPDFCKRYCHGIKTDKKALSNITKILRIVCDGDLGVDTSLDKTKRTDFEKFQMVMWSIAVSNVEMNKELTVSDVVVDMTNEQILTLAKHFDFLVDPETFRTELGKSVNIGVTTMQEDDKTAWKMWCDKINNHVTYPYGQPNSTQVFLRILRYTTSKISSAVARVNNHRKMQKNQQIV